MQLRCVIADDGQAFVKWSGGSCRAGADGVTVAGAASSGAEAVQRAEVLRPDVVLIDIRPGQESGFGVARQLADNEHPAAPIMISTRARADFADLIADSPAAGLVPKARLSAAAFSGRADQRPLSARSPPGHSGTGRQ